MKFSIRRTNNFHTIRKLRNEIFGKELGISENNIFDNDDQKLGQFIIINNEKPIGTFRLRDQGNSYKIERMGILSPYRSKGLGKLTLEKIKSYSKKNNKTKIVLDSIYDVRGFYVKSGFVQNGDKYSKVGIPHVKMSLDL